MEFRATTGRESGANGGLRLFQNNLKKIPAFDVDIRLRKPNNAGDIRLTVDLALQIFP